MTAPKKCYRQTTRFCSGTHRVYPALCFDFINYPISAILHPFLFTCNTRGDTVTDDISPQPSCGRSRTQLATWRLSCDHSSTANFPAHNDPAPMQPHYEEWWHGGERGHPTKIRRHPQPRSGARTKRQDHIVVCCFLTLIWCMRRSDYGVVWSFSILLPVPKNNQLPKMNFPNALKSSENALKTRLF